MRLSSGGFTAPCLFVLGRLGGDAAVGGGRGGELLGSSGCSVEISALVFCSIVLRGGGVLRGCLFPCSALVGAWSLCLAEVVGGDSCWSAILGLVLLMTQFIYTKFISNNCALFHLW